MNERLFLLYLLAICCLFGCGETQMNNKLTKVSFERRYVNGPIIDTLSMNLKKFWKGDTLHFIYLENLYVDEQMSISLFGSNRKCINLAGGEFTLLKRTTENLVYKASEGMSRATMTVNMNEGIIQTNSGDGVMRRIINIEK